METLGIVVALLVAVALVISRINAKYEDAKPQSEDDDRSPEVIFQTAWEEFAADEPLTVARARIDRLLDLLTIRDLEQKSMVVQLAVMAARAERFDLLPELAMRAEELDAHCGETRSLRVLSELYHGDDMAEAKRLFAEAQQATAGCAKCSASLESKLLATEIAVAAELFEQRMSDRAADETSHSPHGTLTLRRV